MSRINIEESWWSDPRKSKLQKLLGESLASGCAIRAWRTAHLYRETHQSLVPIEVWELIDGNKELVECRLAEVTESGVRVFGSKLYKDGYHGI